MARTFKHQIKFSEYLEVLMNNNVWLLDFFYEYNQWLSDPKEGQGKRVNPFSSIFLTWHPVLPRMLLWKYLAFGIRMHANLLLASFLCSTKATYHLTVCLFLPKSGVSMAEVGPDTTSLLASHSACSIFLWLLTYWISSSWTLVLSFIG